MQTSASTSDTPRKLPEFGCIERQYLAVLVLVAAGLAALLAFRWLQRSFGSGLKRPPHARSIPWLGDAFAFATDCLGLMEKNHKRYGPIYSQTLIGMHFIHVGSVSGMRKVLGSEGTLVEASYPVTFLMLLGRHSLVFRHGEEHARVRTLFQPAYTSKAVMGYVPQIARIFEGCVDKWIREGSINGRSAVNAATFQVAIEIIIGFDDSWLQPDMLPKVQDAWRDFLGGLMAPPIRLLAYIPGTSFYKAVRARKFLMKATYQALDKVQRRIDRRQEVDGNKGAAFCFLTEKDAKGRPYSMGQAADLCMNLLFAGHETTSQAILMMLLTLRQNPAVYNRLQQEQEEVVAKHGKEVTEAALKEMPYTDACIREVLRIFPVAGLVGRRAKQDFKVDGFHIKKGDELWLGINRSTRLLDERWQNNAEFPNSKFMPERHLTVEGRDIGLSYLAFGGGTRYCMGQTLAIMEMKVMLVVLMRRAEWHINVEEKVAYFPITTPADGLPMTLAAKA